QPGGHELEQRLHRGAVQLPEPAAIHEEEQPQAEEAQADDHVGQGGIEVGAKLALRDRQGRRHGHLFSAASATGSAALAASVSSSSLSSSSSSSSSAGPAATAS